MSAMSNEALGFIDNVDFVTREIANERELTHGQEYSLRALTKLKTLLLRPFIFDGLKSVLTLGEQSASALPYLSANSAAAFMAIGTSHADSGIAEQCARETKLSFLGENCDGVSDIDLAISLRPNKKDASGIQDLFSKVSSTLSESGSALFLLPNSLSPFASEYSGSTLGVSGEDLITGSLQTVKYELEVHGFKEVEEFLVYPDSVTPRLIINSQLLAQSGLSLHDAIRSALGEHPGLTSYDLNSHPTVSVIAPSFLFLAHRHRVRRLMHDNWVMTRFERDLGTSEIYEERVYFENGAPKIVRAQTGLCTDENWQVDNIIAKPQIKTSQELLKSVHQLEGLVKNLDSQLHSSLYFSQRREKILRSGLDEQELQIRGLTQRLMALGEGQAKLRAQLAARTEELETVLDRSAMHTALAGELRCELRRKEDQLNKLRKRPLVKLSQFLSRFG